MRVFTLRAKGGEERRETDVLAGGCCARASVLAMVPAGVGYAMCVCVCVRVRDSE